MATKLPSMDEVRQDILQAASDRFARFGYGKTNVAEIARDCGMSAGNLYRYFKNKLDIAQCLVRRVMQETLVELRAVMAEEGLTPQERLRKFHFKQLDFTFEHLDTYPTLLETANEIKAHTPMLANEYLAEARTLMGKILQEGNAKDVFDVQDIEETAEIIQCATMKFTWPQIHSSLGIEALHKELEGVLSIMVRGLKCPGDQPLSR